MSAIENSKLTVVGAGSVGASTAYAALIRGSARHVALYDIATAKVEAEVLDLAHGTQFTGASDIIGGSDLSVVEGSHVVVITAGAKQKPGQSRIELAEVNAGILRTMMPELLSVAPDAVYVVVTNPCDVLTVLAREATALPPERMGYFMGLFNFFVVIPQICSGVLLGFFTKHLFDGHTGPTLALGGASMALAGILTLFVTDNSKAARAT